MYFTLLISRRLFIKFKTKKKNLKGEWKTTTKEFKSHNKFSWIFNLDDNYRMMLLNNIFIEQISMSRAATLAKNEKVIFIFKVLTFFKILKKVRFFYVILISSGLAKN